MFLSGMICGKNLGSAPNTSWPPFSSSSETPIAVMSAASRDDRRTGRYAARSITHPAIPHPTIADTSTSSALAGFGFCAAWKKRAE